MAHTTKPWEHAGSLGQHPTWALFTVHLVSGDTPVRLFSPGQVQISTGCSLLLRLYLRRGAKHTTMFLREPSQGAGFTERSPLGLHRTMEELTPTARTPHARVTAPERKQPSPSL